MAISGEMIKKIRESRGKNQQDLAEKIDKSQGYIAKLENNNITGGIKGDELLIIAEYLEYDPYVFSGKLSLTDGDLTNTGYKKTITELIREVHDLREKYNQENEEGLVNRIKNNPELRRLFSRIQDWPADKIKELTALAHGYFSGI